jgi:D-sedoheptulose 7-phosphate isomerase
MTAAGTEPTSFLYPFIDAEERDVGKLLTDLGASARAKIEASARLRRETVARCAPMIDVVADAMARSFRSGGRLFTFGNGGSSTDAQLAATRFRHPPHGRPLPAICLTDDRAVLTALANDVGFDLVFSRQLDAHARAGDVAFGFSTSGGSANVLRAFAAANARGILTVGLAGYDGGAMAASDDVEHCLVVRSESVHRIQEAQATVLTAVWSAVQTRLESMGVR